MAQYFARLNRQPKTGADKIDGKTGGEKAYQRGQSELAHRQAEEKRKGNANDFKHRAPGHAISLRHPKIARPDRGNAVWQSIDIPPALRGELLRAPSGIGRDCQGQSVLPALWNFTRRIREAALEDRDRR